MNNVLVVCFALGGAVLAATSAQAACHQEYVSVSCDRAGHCVNNFKTVCTPDPKPAPGLPIAKTGGVPAGVGVATMPLVVARPGAGIISENGAGLIKPGANALSDAGSGFKPGANLVSDRGAGLVGNAGGTLRNK